MSKRPPKENLIPRRGPQPGKSHPEKGEGTSPKGPPPQKPMPHPVRTPTGNQRGR
ncbi:MAG TPA: hypothetical protein VG692_06385 [Gemmatimonadales bacterium]|nr:hypothetical protein [Gemmatimonadales bacterium]